MDYKFVNGCLNPILDVVKPDGTTYLRFNAPGCNEDGMIETHEEISTERDDLNSESKKYFIGWKRHWALNYNKIINATNYLKFKEVIDCAHNVTPGGPFKILLTPRSDNLADRIEILFEKNNLIVAILKGKKKAPGNKDVIIKMKSVKVFKELQLSDPNKVQQVYLNNLFINS